MRERTGAQAPRCDTKRDLSEIKLAVRSPLILLRIIKPIKQKPVDIRRGKRRGLHASLFRAIAQAALYRWTSETLRFTIKRHNFFHIHIKHPRK